MHITTFSGPPSTRREAREILDEHYFVLSIPNTSPFVLGDDEVALSIEANDPDAQDMILHLGWRHRATIARGVGTAMPVSRNVL
jgi:hypothetical protein